MADEYNYNWSNWLIVVWVRLFSKKKKKLRTNLIICAKFDVEFFVAYFFHFYIKMMKIENNSSSNYKGDGAELSRKKHNLQMKCQTELRNKRCPLELEKEAETIRKLALWFVLFSWFSSHRDSRMPYFSLKVHSVWHLCHSLLLYYCRHCWSRIVELFKVWSTGNWMHAWTS